MNRIIKFRAWEIETKKMYHFKDIGSCSEYNTLTFDWDWEIDGAAEPGFGDLELSHSADDFELMQFTGLLDKNGKEIYEGDILSSEYPRKDCKNCHPVVWRSGSWCVDHRINDCCRPWRGDLRGHHSSEEVIGNIYENPELV